MENKDSGTIRKEANFRNSSVSFEITFIRDQSPLYLKI